MDTLVLLDELEEIEECTISDSKRKEGGKERIECAIYFIKLFLESRARSLKFTSENARTLWAWPRVQSNMSHMMKMRADHNNIMKRVFIKKLA